MIDKLREEVFRANLELGRSNLVILTWGNVSAYDPQNGRVIIKPSGVPYDQMTAESMVVCDIDGNIIEGKLKPSSDLPTHLELYRSFPEIRGVVHTHSRYATAWAQSGRSIPALGTTHADYFYGEVPCTRALTSDEVKDDYELNTGRVIVETFEGTDYLSIPAVLVCSHGPFTWAESPSKAVENSIVLEEVAAMAAVTFGIAEKGNIEDYLLDKHYLRKHGKDSYYGQK